MPISVTNFPFRVASRRYSYGGTADERPVICNTDNEVPEEQEWAISEANTAARAVRKKKDNPYTPKPEPRSRAEPQDRIVDSTGGGAGTIQGALADDSERSPPAPVTIPMAVTAAEAANPRATSPSLVKYFGSAYASWVLDRWTRQPRPDCEGSTWTIPLFKDDVSGIGTYMMLVNLHREATHRAGMNRIFTPVNTRAHAFDSERLQLEGSRSSSGSASLRGIGFRGIKVSRRTRQQRTTPSFAAFISASASVKTERFIFHHAMLISGHPSSQRSQAMSIGRPSRYSISRSRICPRKFSTSGAQKR